MTKISEWRSDAESYVRRAFYNTNKAESKGAPATYKQTWYLYCFGKKAGLDVYRQDDYKENLTKSVAYKIIKLLKTESEGDKIEAYKLLTQEGLDEYEVFLPEEERKEAKSQAEEKKAQDPEHKPTNIPVYTPKLDGYIKPKVFDRICHMVNNKVDTMLYGRSGTGKSLMAKAISTALDWGFFSINFTEGLRYSDIFEFTTLKNGKTEREKSDLMKAFEEPGIVFLDEAFAIEPGVALGLNKLLQEGYYQSRVGVIKRHEDCVVMLGANTMGRGNSQKYRGAKRADMSFIGRFCAYELDYDEGVERGIAKKYLDAKAAGIVLHRVWDLREKVKLNRIQFDVSSRALEKACMLINYGFSVDDSIEYAFLNLLTEVDRAKVKE